MNFIQNIVKLCYQNLPSGTVRAIGKSSLLKGVRNTILRPNNSELITTEKIEWNNAKFIFNAPLKMAIKAKKYGIENKLLKNSLFLLNQKGIDSVNILDVGANYGFVSLVLQKCLPSTTKIFSFEPHPEVFNVLKETILENKMENIKLKNVAVGNENNEIDICLFGQSSVVTQEKNDRRITRKIKVEQIKLDDFIQKESIVPHFIKIDVDGYELNVLEGLKESIIKYKPVMVVETNEDQQVISFLKEMNYELFDLDLNPHIDGEMPNNVFCI